LSNLWARLGDCNFANATGIHGSSAAKEVKGKKKIEEKRKQEF
jgi:hypothetical protein